MEITGLGRLTFNVVDPLKRSWPKGKDTEIANNALNRIQQYQASAAAKQ